MELSANPEVKVSIVRLTGWDEVVDSARTTMGKESLGKEPSDKFKQSILIKEHSPIRNLTYRIIWENIPYWVAMHFRTHHNGFKSSEDDLYFVKTQRTDRTQIQRNDIPQNAPVNLRAILNAQSIINVSRVRICRQAMLETRHAWNLFLEELNKVEPFLAKLCVPNCIYRGFCNELENCCGYVNTEEYSNKLTEYRTKL